MTAPQYTPPQQFPAQFTQPQGYPPQPAYPAAPPVQPQPYAQPGYPAQPYGAPVAGQQFAPPQQSLAQGSLDDFFNQPSAGGGKSLSFHQKQYGTTYVGIVTRPLSGGDVQQQTDTMGRPQFYKDGRPKFVMKVPLQMQPSPEYPDGLATWFVKGQARDELVRAMAEAGAPVGPPEANAVISIQYTGERQSGAGMNPAKQFRVTYQRPDGSTPAPQPAAAAPAQVPQQPDVQQPGPGVPYPATPTAQPGVSPVQQPHVYQQPIPSNTASATPQATPAQPAPPSDLSAEQQALLARLTGGQQSG